MSALKCFFILKGIHTFLHETHHSILYTTDTTILRLPNFPHSSSLNVTFLCHLYNFQLKVIILDHSGLDVLIFLFFLSLRSLCVLYVVSLSQLSYHTRFLLRIPNLQDGTNNRQREHALEQNRSSVTSSLSRINIIVFLVL